MTTPHRLMRPDPVRSAAQMSRANIFDGRARGPRAMRRAHVARPDRDGFARRWSHLMIASFAGCESAAVHFGVTYQTACNWRDGSNCPSGHHVEYARQTLPAYRRVMGGAG